LKNALTLAAAFWLLTFPSCPDSEGDWILSGACGLLSEFVVILCGEAVAFQINGCSLHV